MEVLPGNAPDNLGALELVEASEANTGVPVEETMGDAAYGDGDTRQAFADAGHTLIARVPGRPNRTHFPKEDFRIDLESGSCTCPAGQVTRDDGAGGTAHRPNGSDLPFRGLPIRRGGLRGMSASAPVRGGKTGYGTNGATAPAGSPVATGPRLTAERGLCRVPAAAGGGRTPAGAAGPTGDPPVPLLRPCQNPVPVVPGRHRGQPDPGGRQNRVDRRNRLRSQRRQRPGRWPGQLRHRMARANLDPHPARIGLTDQIPLPNKGFPSGFLADCLKLLCDLRRFLLLIRRLPTPAGGHQRRQLHSILDQVLGHPHASAVSGEVLAEARSLGGLVQAGGGNREAALPGQVGQVGSDQGRRGRHGQGAPGVGPGLEGAPGRGVHGPGVGGDAVVEGCLDPLDVGVGQVACRAWR